MWFAWWKYCRTQHDMKKSMYSTLRNDRLSHHNIFFMWSTLWKNRVTHPSPYTYHIVKLHMDSMWFASMVRTFNAS